MTFKSASISFIDIFFSCSLSKVASTSPSYSPTSPATSCDSDSPTSPPATNMDYHPHHRMTAPLVAPMLYRPVAISPYTQFEHKPLNPPTACSYPEINYTRCHTMNSQNHWSPSHNDAAFYNDKYYNRSYGPTVLSERSPYSVQIN